MLIILLTLLFCVAQNLVPEASFFVGWETNAAILGLGIFVLIVFRAWSVAPVKSLRTASQ